MEQADKLSEFEKFAMERGYEVEGRTVYFGEDAEAAIAFETAAHKAGFNVTRSSAEEPRFYHGAGKIGGGPKIWFVRLDR